MGGVRRSSSASTARLSELNILDDVKLIDFELLESSNMHSAIVKVKPDEIYNMAAQSFVGSSFSQPLYTSQVDGVAVLN